MQEKITMAVYLADQERLKPFFDPKETWADALKKALDDLERLQRGT
jgi:hypothetical protein